MYPKIILNYDKLVENTKMLVERCHREGISVMAVTKGASCWQEVQNAYEEGGVDFIADSRIENFCFDTKLRKVLLRLPQQCQYKQVVERCDISLNSSLTTIKALNEEAIKQNKRHGIILMFDLGDLREGIFYTNEYLDVVSKILKLENIDLTGIGTNLTCYGAVIPTKETLDKLAKIGKDIENTFNIELEIKSFGNSSSVYLLGDSASYEYFNNLRLGEVLLLGREAAYGEFIEGMNYDVFKLQAQIIEVYRKPSLPEGKIGMNAFGKTVEFEDRGEMLRGILAIGKQDVNIEDLVVTDPNIELIGSSSDHTIIELKTDEYQIGDIVEFGITYGSLLSLTTSRYVSRGVENGK